jgi:hypothetical protein
MKRWIDMTNQLKSLAPARAFDFFINPFRWKWALFVFFGIGAGLPRAIVEREEQLRDGLGYKKRYVD